MRRWLIFVAFLLAGCVSYADKSAKIYFVDQNDVEAKLSEDFPKEVPSVVTTSVEVESDASENPTAFEISNPKSPAQPEIYVVKKGDTLSSIAKSYGLNATGLAKANKIEANQLKVGQKLTLTDKYDSSASPTSKNPAPATSSVATTSKEAPCSADTAPIKHIKKEKIDTNDLKGTLYLTARDEDVYSIAKGEVLYVGEFAGMGNMVLVQQTSELTVAYGFLSKYSVKEGDKVSLCTKIGQSGTVKNQGKGLLLQKRKNGRIE